MLAWIIATIVMIVLIILTIRRKFSKKWLKVILISGNIAHPILYLSNNFPMSPVPKPTGSDWSTGGYGILCP